MSRTIDNQSATIKSLELTIKNLEEQLLKKEDVLASAEAKKKTLGKIFEKKNEKVKTTFVPKTQEEKDAEEARRDAERGAIYYTLACSCRLCGVNFFDYLTDVIDRMADLPPKQSHEVYRNLLPDRWSLKSM